MAILTYLYRDDGIRLFVWTELVRVNVPVSSSKMNVPNIDEFLLIFNSAYCTHFTGSIPYCFNINVSII